MKKAKDKIIFISGSSYLAELNLVKYITRIVLRRDNAIKVLSSYEKIKENLDNLCVTNIGMSAHTTEQKERELLNPLFGSYSHLMNYLNEGWWAEQGELYISSLMKFLPPAVKFLITDCNSKALLQAPLCQDNPVVRVKNNDKTPSLFPHLSDSEFKGAIDGRPYFKLNLQGETHIDKEEDIVPCDLKETENLLSQINDS
jgi:hypothetical protein